MSKQTLIIVVLAVVLFGLGVFGAMAFTGSDDSTPMMTMPDGATMPSDQMTDGMPSDQMTDGMDMTP